MGGIMNKRHRRRSWGVAVVSASALALIVPGSTGSATAQAAHRMATTYRQVNLVSNVPGKAQITDPNLVNAWGASFGPTTPLWVSDNGKDVTTLYAGGVHNSPQTIVPLVVSIPGGVPTGQAFNPTMSFVVHGSDGSKGPALFLFDSESGHITGWNPGVPADSGPPSTEAQNAVTTPGAVYKGLSLGMTSSGPRLYAADFSAATVDVYNGRFQRVITPGNFEDRMLPAHYAPFNVAVLGNRVYVAYAKQSPEKLDEIDGRGLGRLDVFTMDGRLLRRLPQHDVLNGPWGLAIAPAGFGSFSGHLLVGNFGNGRIHAFDPHSLLFKGTLRNGHGRPLVIDGLWALLPGNGVEAGHDQVIFTAGPNDESDGLLGTLTAR
jgi:uncharacterized protein (TIGR03118 family)